MFFYVDIYDITLTNYITFIKDTLNTYYTSNICEFDNAVHCTWKH